MKFQAKKLAGNMLLTIASVVVTCVAVIAMDRVVGRLFPSTVLDSGLIYAPHTAAYYDTLEFKSTVYINNLGFRGDDTTLEKSQAVRVVAIGDSFTYGWGVDLADTWLKQLETALRAEGRDIEILNLGIPGTSPGQYAETAERVIPVLKPDIVLLGLLQGDDLEQVERWRPRQPSPESGDTPPEQQRETTVAVAQRLVPNLSRMSVNALRSISPQLAMTITGRMTPIQEKWKKQAHTFVDSMTPADLQQFQQSTPSIREALLEGRLNPAQLRWLYPESAKQGAQKPVTPQPAAPAKPSNEQTKPPANKPVSTNPALNLNSNMTKRRIELCVPYLERIRKVADDNGARVVALAIPQTSYIIISGWQRLFEPFNTPEMLRERDENLVTTVPDQALQLACDRAGIPMVQVTAAYRDAAKNRNDLFYDYDGHFTPEGNRLFADQLLPVLKPHLEPIPSH